MKFAYARSVEDDLRRGDSTFGPCGGTDTKSHELIGDEIQTRN